MANREGGVVFPTEPVRLTGGTTEQATQTARTLPARPAWGQRSGPVNRNSAPGCSTPEGGGGGQPPSGLFGEGVEAPTGWGLARSLLLIEGTKLKYVGPGADDSDAAAVRANRPAPRSSGIYYFEVEILSQGRDGYIGIGLCGPNVNLRRLPGWDRHSYGYHGDDGNIFEWSGKGNPYGPTYGTGDVIGVALNWITRSVTFYKNGMDLGVAFVDIAEDVLFPTVGCRTPGEELRANFGSRPFQVDYQQLRQNAIQSTFQSILDARLPLPDPSFDHGRSLQTQIGSAAAGKTKFKGKVEFIYVMQYLFNSGYPLSAAALAREALGNDLPDESEEFADVQFRGSVQTAINCGDIASANTLLEGKCPGFSERYPALAFRLKCLHLSNLIVEEGDATAMAYFSREVAGCAEMRSAEGRRLLEEVMALMAYPKPLESPAAYVTGSAYRAKTSTLVNEMLLLLSGRDYTWSAVETAVRQMVAILGELRRLEHPQSILVNELNIIGCDARDNNTGPPSSPTSSDSYHIEYG